MFSSLKVISILSMFLCVLLEGCMLYDILRLDMSKETCLSCHNIYFKDLHGNFFTCTDCHPNLANAPSSDRVYQVCMKCHYKEVQGFYRGSHYTYKNMITKTFKNFGVDVDLTLQDLKSIKQINTKNLKVNKKSDINIHLISDFLRSRCLSCHVEYEGENYPKTKRAKGCLACHFHNIQGKTKEKKFFAIKKPEDEKCLSCHYSLYIGWDYYGYFPHNWYVDYRSPFINGTTPERVYGIEFYTLRPSIHKERGLKCINCHKKEEVMFNKKRRSCKDCHKNLSKKFHNQSLLRSIRCEVCHANFVIREKILECYLDFNPSLEDWIDLMVQESWEIEEYFRNRLRGVAIPAKMKDKVSLELREGLWLCKNGGRSFEITEYGRDEEGKICILRKRDMILKFKEDVIVKGTFERCVVPHSIGKGNFLGGFLNEDRRKKK